MSRAAELAAIEAHVAAFAVRRCPTAFATTTTAIISYGEIASRLATMRLKRTPTAAEMVKAFWMWRQRGVA